MHFPSRDARPPLLQKHNKPLQRQTIGAKGWLQRIPNTFLPFYGSYLHRTTCSTELRVLAYMLSASLLHTISTIFAAFLRTATRRTRGGTASIALRRCAFALSADLQRSHFFFLVTLTWATLSYRAVHRWHRLFFFPSVSHQVYWIGLDWTAIKWDWIEMGWSVCACCFSFLFTKMGAGLVFIFSQVVFGDCFIWDRMETGRDGTHSSFSFSFLFFFWDREKGGKARRMDGLSDTEFLNAFYLYIQTCVCACLRGVELDMS